MSSKNALIHSRKRNVSGNITVIIRQVPFVMMLFISIVYARPAYSSDMALFSTVNQSPFIQVFGLPAFKSPDILDSGRYETGFSFNLSNNFTLDDDADESVFIDGETYRTTFRLRRGFGHGFEAGAELSYVSHDGGFMDSFIESWHDTFSLPNGNRDDYGRDDLRYEYVRNGDALVDISSPESGPGDMTLTFGYAPRAFEGERTFAVRAALKLPTGDSEKLTGSGSTDLALFISGRDCLSLSEYNIALLGTAGLLLMTDGDVLPDMQKNAVFFGSMGAGWRLSPSFRPKMQVDWHSPFYENTDMKQLGSWSAQLTFGAEVLFSGFVLDIGLSEDIVVDTSPDVVFHAAISREF